MLKINNEDAPFKTFSIVSIVNFERVNMFKFINKKVKATEKLKKILFF